MTVSAQAEEVHVDQSIDIKECRYEFCVGHGSFFLS
jgi:hypothetical protein